MYIRALAYNSPLDNIAMATYKAMYSIVDNNGCKAILLLHNVHTYVSILVPCDNIMHKVPETFHFLFEHSLAVCKLHILHLTHKHTRMHAHTHAHTHR